MAPLRVGVDLGASPLRVGGLVLGKYIVVNGSKDVKVNGEEPPSRADVLQALEDARGCVRSFFGAREFSSAVVVVPNSTSNRNREAILSIARGAGFNVVNVISENIAVACAYSEKVKNTSAKRIVIISDKGGVLDVSVVTVRPAGEDELYSSRYCVTAWQTHPGELEAHKKHGPGGLIGFVAGAVKTIVVEPFEILSSIFSSPEFKDAEVDEVVFVGEVSKSEKVRHAVQKRYPKATVWEGIEATDIAAYGAGVVAYKDEKIQTGLWATPPTVGDVNVGGASSDWQDEVTKQQVDDEADDQDEEDEDFGVQKPFKLSSVVR